ncbi:respiratory nitrate reductase subunit gamma [bacterium]|nr:respiratory nitrate reductase subunit gamma [bacterium]
MQAWLDFGSGPLFRFSFVLMILGLVRIFILTIVGLIENYQRSPDKIIPWRDLLNKTFSWLVPVFRVWSKRPLYGGVSILFHVGLILVPLFYGGHVLLWKNSVGFAWPALSLGLADFLTLTTIAGGIIMFLARALYAPARALSRKQDYVWPLLLVVPFITGYFAVHQSLNPAAYQWIMLLHIYSANVIMVMIPFTKIAHCILLPLSQLVTGLSWKFPAGAGQRVLETMGYDNQPTWIEKPRLEKEPKINVEVAKETVAE